MITYDVEIDDVMYKIDVGKNAAENWDLISEASQSDVWFHLGKELPSPHVILHVPDGIKKLPKKIIKRCSVLCKEHSKYNNIKKVPIIYTKIHNVTKGNTVGSVYTKQTKSLVI
jgi:predicted ribosome quality control (RQC) complex YloA/Tae2 family protein